MSEVDVIPELKQIIGAMLFAAKEPVSVSQMLNVFEQTAEQHGGMTKDFAKVTDEMIRDAVKELNEELTSRSVGMHVREVANGFRLVNDANCGLWLRVLLEKGKPNRLSRPALETLAIIAYRQPVVHSEIEAVRGVAVDQIIRNLLDLQLIRVVGRSELPGRPWLFGTTQKFLEHFGIKSLNDLPGIEELRRLEAEQIKKQEKEKKDAETVAAAEASEESGEVAETAAAPEESAAPETDDDDTYSEDEDEFDDDDDSDDEEDDDSDEDREPR